MISGLDEQGGQLATAVLKELGKWWRRLIIAEDGFLTGYERGGVKRQAVLWGEMDSMVCIPYDEGAVLMETETCQ